MFKNRCSIVMKYLEKSVHDRIFEIIQQDNRLCFVNEIVYDVSNVIKQHMYDMTYQDSIIGQCVMTDSLIGPCIMTDLDSINIIGITFSIDDKTIEFTDKDSIESIASRYKLQYFNELMLRQMELARIQAM